VNLLWKDGQYSEGDRSLAFPFLPVAELVRFLGLRDVSETRLVREFRRWVREQQTRGWGAKKTRRNGGKDPLKGRRKPQ
jgi:hypothetical protein